MSIQSDAADIIRQLRSEEEARVRVALFGQPGAGKSSLINALTGKELAPVGTRTDMTQSCQTFEWGPVILADLPGYGTSKFPKETYFKRFDIESFDVFLCVAANKFTASDTEFFRALKAAGKTCLFVRNQRDMIWQDGKTLEQLELDILQDTRKHLDDASITVLFTSCRERTGIDRLSTAIHQSLDSAKAERWARTAKAYTLDFLERKYEAGRKHVTVAAGLAAANALNPVPGVDMAADLGILSKMFSNVRSSYGLDADTVSVKSKILPMIAPQASRLLTFGTVQGIPLLLKRFVKRATLKQVSKYVPFVGQAIAASLGFGISLQAGLAYLDDCHAVAKAILEEELRRSRR